jgi:hypothetical protein
MASLREDVLEPERDLIEARVDARMFSLRDRN